MKLSIREPLGYQLSIMPEQSTKGKIVDFIIDQKNYKIKYIVVDSGNFLSQKLKYIPSKFIRSLDFKERTIHTILNSKEFLEFDETNSIETISSIFKQKQKDMFDQMQFWELRFYPNVSIPFVTHNLAISGLNSQTSIDLNEQELDTDLRSVRELLGYAVNVSDSKQLTLKDFVVDTINWRLKKLVLGNQYGVPWQKKYELDMKEVKSISYSSKSVYTHGTAGRNLSLNEFDISKPINKNAYGVYYDYRGVVQEK
ncbi:MAG: PRC-barrel domain-containing protein [Crocinitomicaceae bacterium]